jgi:hypothetical protein
MNGAWKAGLAVVLACAAAPAMAQAPLPAGRAAALKSLTDCRAVTDSVARLACFDQAAAALDAAERSGDVVVLDRAQVRTAKREAFGLKLPSFDLFDRDEQQRTVEVDRVESTVASAGRGQAGWVVTLANGQVWRQTDGKSLYRVRQGDKVEIRRGTLGSYFLRVGNQPGVRAVRAG